MIEGDFKEMGPRDVKILSIKGNYFEIGVQLNLKQKEGKKSL